MSAATFRRTSKFEQALVAIQEAELLDPENPEVWVQVISFPSSRFGILFDGRLSFAERKIDRKEASKKANPHLPDPFLPPLPFLSFFLSSSASTTTPLTPQPSPSRPSSNPSSSTPPTSPPSSTSPASTPSTRPLRISPLRTASSTRLPRSKGGTAPRRGTFWQRCARCRVGGRRGSGSVWSLRGGWRGQGR
jgi:hypothetical protein